MSRRLLLIAGGAEVCFLVAVVCFLVAATPASAEQLAVQSTTASAWPQVGITVTLPARAVDGPAPSAVRIWENGVPVKDARLQPLEHDAEPIDVVLAVDVSGSMKGTPLADAQAAARRFVESMGARDRIALVAFGSTPATLSRFTNDRSALSLSIGQLTAKGETALYDGISSALDLTSKEQGRRHALIVLTDGKDTMSSTSLDDVVGSARKTGVPVYMVGLKSSDYDPKTLGAIAGSSGGRLVSANDSASLVGIYGQLAKELQRVYQVTFTSLKPNTPDLEIRMDVQGAAVPLTKTLYVTNRSFAASAEPMVPPPPLTLLQRVFSVATASAVVTLAGLAAGLLAFAVIGALIRPKRPIDELALYDQVHDAGLETGARGSVVDQSRLKVVGLVEQVAARRGFTGLAHEMLERAGLPLRVSEYITLHVIGVLICGFLAQLLTRNVLVVTLVVGIATALPVLLLDWAGSRRRKAFEEQLPDILTLMAGSLRAGYGLQQSIHLVVQQVAEPALTEFKRVEAETRLGLPLDQALSRVAERLDSDAFRWTASAIAIQREVGGNLSEVLDTLAATIRERADLLREVHSLTAEGRLSAGFLELMPFFLAVWLLIFNPRYISLLVSSVLGLALLGTGAVLLLVGIVWLQKVVTIDV